MYVCINILTLTVIILKHLDRSKKLSEWEISTMQVIFMIIPAQKPLMFSHFGFHTYLQLLPNGKVITHKYLRLQGYHTHSR